MARIIISLLLIAGIGGIVSNDASAAVPGDMLYPFKTGVNESLGRLFSATESSKARFAADIAHQRLGELQTLTQNGTLTPSVEKDLITCFDTEVADMTNAIKLMETNYDYDAALSIATQFQTTLAAHIAVLTALHSSDVAHVQSALDSMSALISDLSQKITK